MSGTCDVEGVVMCGTCHAGELRCQGIGISATFVHSSTHDFLLCARVIFVCAHVCFFQVALFDLATCGC